MKRLEARAFGCQQPASEQSARIALIPDVRWASVAKRAAGLAGAALVLKLERIFIHASLALRSMAGFGTGGGARQSVPVRQDAAANQLPDGRLFSGRNEVRN